MADTNLYDPDTGTPLIGRWPLDMALQHARERDHGDAGYDSHMRAALRAIDLLKAEIQRIATIVRRHDGDQWHECTSERECMDTLRRQAKPRIARSTT